MSVMLNRPPVPGRDLNQWARQLYEYLSAQSPVKGTVDPSPILLPHIVSEQMPRAETSGVLLFDPASSSVVVSKNGVWVSLLDDDTDLGLTLAGDVTGAIGANELIEVNDDAGTHGNSSSALQITIDAKGRILDVAAIAISVPATAINDSTAAGRAMLTAADASAQTALLDVFTAMTDGLVPASGGATDEFLSADGTFKVAGEYHFGQLTADYRLANSASPQKLFDFSANGALTLQPGRYEFICNFAITSMSGTSGNGAFSLEGTAVLDDIRMTYWGIDAITGGAISGFTTTSNTTAQNMVNASTSTSLIAVVTGVFEVEVAGTIIPSIDLTNAVSTADVRDGSYFICRKLADTTNNVVGDWS